MIDRAKINGTPTMLLTVREAAKALAVSEKTLWSLTTPRGTIPAIRVGERSLRYSVTALAKWIDSQPLATACAPEVNGDSEE
jgi:excisionase family DNA binding protein